jgi:hypothetical protein
MFHPTFYVGSGMKKCLDPDSGCTNVRIREKHPGSATVGRRNTKKNLNISRELYVNVENKTQFTTEDIVNRYRNYRSLLV